jgi:8-oxo-dGTP diphosphatase
MGKMRPQCGLLIENGEGKVLLQLRDDIPHIPWPNTWGTFGGQIEEGETPEDAMKREIREELMYELHDPEPFGNFPYDGYDIYMYRKLAPDFAIGDVTVCEGQGAAFLSLREVEEAECAANCKEIVIAYYRMFHGR